MTTTTMDRTTGLGGSDMAALLGLDKKRTPLDLYLEKVGESDGFGGNEATDLGTEFEDSVAKLYAKRTGRKVRRDNREHRHPDHPWAMAHVDRRIIGERGRVLEVKCSSVAGWGEEGTDQIPEHFLPQVHHYMTVTAAEVCDVAALLWGGYGPPTLRVYTVEPSPAFAALLLEEGERFWTEHVERRVPPDPTTSAQANLRWAKATAGLTATATVEAVEALDTLAVIKSAQKELDARRDAVELTIKSAFGEAETLVDGEGAALATWKEQTQRALDQKALREAHPELAEQFTVINRFRVLRPKKQKKS